MGELKEYPVEWGKITVQNHFEEYKSYLRIERIVGEYIICQRSMQFKIPW